MLQEKPKLPFIPGNEASGIVVEVGMDVRTVEIGDPVVLVSSGGAFAEQVIIDEASVFKLPKTVDLDQVAGLPVAYGTAYMALKERSNIQPGQKILILGAGGGVGLASVQLAKAFGATVLAAARVQNDNKLQVLKDAGADFVIDTSSKSVRTEVKKLFPNGIDLILDPVGGEVFNDSLSCVAWGGQILIIGFASGNIPKIPANILLVKNITVHGIYWGAHLKSAPYIWRRSLEEPLRLLALGQISVNVSHVYALEQWKEAFTVLKKRAVVGKLLFVPEPRSML